MVNYIKTIIFQQLHYIDKNYNGYRIIVPIILQGKKVKNVLLEQRFERELAATDWNYKIKKEVLSK